ncbi:MAG: hypothetical protein ACI9YO_002529 [Gammaproteobacteria bacterium]|jgi:hypothetical protein
MRSSKLDNQLALVRAIELTDDVLLALDDQNFDQIDLLEIERQPLIEQAFTQSMDQIDQIKAIHLQNLNQQVVEKLIIFKQTIKHQQLLAMTGSKATQAYQNHLA